MQYVTGNPFSFGIYEVGPETIQAELKVTVQFSRTLLTRSCEEHSHIVVRLTAAAETGFPVESWVH